MISSVSADHKVSHYDKCTLTQEVLISPPPDLAVLQLGIQLTLLLTCYCVRNLCLYLNTVGSAQESSVSCSCTVTAKNWQQPVLCSTVMQVALYTSLNLYFVFVTHLELIINARTPVGVGVARNQLLPFCTVLVLFCPQTLLSLVFFSSRWLLMLLSQCNPGLPLSLSPVIIAFKLNHILFSPQLGCSCSSCRDDHFAVCPIRMAYMFAAVIRQKRCSSGADFVKRQYKNV